MIGTTTGNGSGELMTVEFTPPLPQAIGMRDLFDVEVFKMNQLRLIPRTELAKSLLAMWGNVSRSARWVTVGTMGQNSDEMRYGGLLRHAEITFASSPMLSSGDDPYFTGMSISPDEQQACRAFLEQRRAKAREQVTAGTITITPASASGLRSCNMAGCRGACGICTPPKAKTPRSRKAAVKKRR